MGLKLFAKAVKLLSLGMVITVTDLRQSAMEYKLNDKLFKYVNAFLWATSSCPKIAECRPSWP